MSVNKYSHLSTCVTCEESALTGISSRLSSSGIWKFGTATGNLEISFHSKFSRFSESWSLHQATHWLITFTRYTLVWADLLLYLYCQWMSGRPVRKPKQSACTETCLPVERDDLTADSLACLVIAVLEAVFSSAARSHV